MQNPRGEVIPRASHYFGRITPFATTDRLKASESPPCRISVMIGHSQVSRRVSLATKLTGWRSRYLLAVLCPMQCVTVCHSLSHWCHELTVL